MKLVNSSVLLACLKLQSNKIVPVLNNFKRCIFLSRLFSNKVSLEHVISKLNETADIDDSQANELSSEMPHIPVMSEQILKNLIVVPDGKYLDMTFGAGGHSRLILENYANATVYGLDRDPSVKFYAQQVMHEFPNRFKFFNGKFSESSQLFKLNKNYFDGILMDLGVSSMQFNTPERGFMLSRDGPLDMRMGSQNCSETPTAAQILSHIGEQSLYKVLKYYGQEKKARIISRTIVESRLLFKSLRTTKELAELVSSVAGAKINVDKLNRFSHPATKTFQALRILVNDELNELDYGIKMSHYLLKPNGILAALSFHSLEDTILKRHFTGNDLDATSSTIGKQSSYSSIKTYTQEEISTEIIKPWKQIHKHVITPSDEEVNLNPRSRSAKLRFAKKNADSPYPS